MTREEIIKLAREAGLPSSELYHGNLERFAALVAAAEREACAKVCDELAEKEKPSELWTTYQGVAYKQSAAAIRARGQT